MLTSWRTSLAGAAVLAVACVGLLLHLLTPVQAAALIPIGLGLLAARDNGVPSINVPAAAARMSEALDNAGVVPLTSADVTRAIAQAAPTPREGGGYAAPPGPGGAR